MKDNIENNNNKYTIIIFIKYVYYINIMINK